MTSYKHLNLEHSLVTKIEEKIKQMKDQRHLILNIVNYDHFEHKRNTLVKFLYDLEDDLRETTQVFKATFIQNRELINQIDSLENKFRNLELRGNTNETEYDELKSKVKEMFKEIHFYREQALSKDNIIIELEEKLNFLENKLKKKLEEIFKLQEENIYLKKQNTSHFNLHYSSDNDSFKMNYENPITSETGHYNYHYKLSNNKEKEIITCPDPYSPNTFHIQDDTKTNQSYNEIQDEYINATLEKQICNEHNPESIPQSYYMNSERINEDDFKGNKPNFASEEQQEDEENDIDNIIIPSKASAYHSKPVFTKPPNKPDINHNDQLTTETKTYDVMLKERLNQKSEIANIIKLRSVKRERKLSKNEEIIIENIEKNQEDEPQMESTDKLPEPDSNSMPIESKKLNKADRIYNIVMKVNSNQGLANILSTIFGQDYITNLLNNTSDNDSQLDNIEKIIMEVDTLSSNRNNSDRNTLSANTNSSKREFEKPLYKTSNYQFDSELKDDMSDFNSNKYRNLDVIYQNNLNKSSSSTKIIKPTNQNLTDKPFDKTLRSYNSNNYVTCKTFVNYTNPYGHFFDESLQKGGESKLKTNARSKSKNRRPQFYDQGAYSNNRNTKTFYY